jgi:hypothetical protein
VKRDGIHRKLSKTLQNHFIDTVERDGFLRQLFKTWQDHSIAALNTETKWSKKSAALRCAFFCRRCLTVIGQWRYGRNLGGGGRQGLQMSPQYFFYLRIFFLANQLKRGKLKKSGVTEGERGVCILRTG